MVESHFLDKDGNPAGGWTTGIGLDIRWQNGPRGQAEDWQEPNGADIRDVITAGLHRLIWLNNHFPCPENEVAIQHLEAALAADTARTSNRLERGVEGIHAI